MTNGPIVLLIMDGWGIAPDSESNPITRTKLPAFDRLFKQSKHAKLWAHGEYVGLMKDQDGNSEAGHLNLGAGRIVRQDPAVISEAVANGTFFKNPAFGEAMHHVRKYNSALHLMGMLSDGQSAHATPEHLYALLDLADRNKIERVFVHLFTDGRDSSPKAGLELYRQLQRHLHDSQKVATIIGRFYAMDRKKAWSRTEMTYNAIVLGEGECVHDPEEVFTDAYARGLSDEFITPHVLCENDKPIAAIENNDAIIFFNHRSDRARQLTKPFVQVDFQLANPGSFVPKRILTNVRFVAMTDFGPDLDDILTAYPSVDVERTLPMSLVGRKQIYIAESEKYAHMTYFFNGGYADPVGGEDRKMIHSPDVPHYDETPAMSTSEITEAVVAAAKGGYQFVAANIACTDMVAHTGNFAAAQAALSAADKALGAIMAAVKAKNGILVVTADHGNIEEMKNLAAGVKDTEHSKNRVPFVVWGPGYQFKNLREEGLLADVAPTILELFALPKPEEMTGSSLFINK